MNNNKHLFAFYYAELSLLKQQLLPNAQLFLDDKELYHRIVKVLRIAPGEQITLFDRHINTITQLNTIDKKHFSITVISKDNNKLPHPSITMFVPILKKEALELVFYAMVEMGATEYQLVITQKAARAWGGPKEHERLQKIMIAAAEQSKNFALPITRSNPQVLTDVLSSLSITQGNFIFLDPDGQLLIADLNNNTFKASLPYYLFFGPEGDLTSQEKKLLGQHKFQFYRLTPTILRSWQAASLGLGILRSL